MTWLTLLLLFKIGFTALFVALPMLILPAAALESRLKVDKASAPYIRLYGWALIALLVGYTGGIPAAENGQVPWGVLAMGITSNAGATALMVSPAGVRRGPLMPTVFGLIAAGLVICTLSPHLALSRAF